jgi:hypothetical protein
MNDIKKGLGMGEGGEAMRAFKRKKLDVSLCVCVSACMGVCEG